jgi:uncharacterized coiled-coil protein SlyX
VSLGVKEMTTVEQVEQLKMKIDFYHRFFHKILSKLEKEIAIQEIAIQEIEMSVEEIEILRLEKTLEILERMGEFVANKENKMSNNDVIRYTEILKNMNFE